MHSIDSLSINSFHRLMSPPKPKGNLYFRRIGLLKYSLQCLQVFATRIVFLAVNLFITKHFRWENNASLFKHLQSDLSARDAQGFTSQESYKARRVVFQKFQQDDRLKSLNKKVVRQFDKALYYRDPVLKLSSEEAHFVRDHDAHQILQLAVSTNNIRLMECCLDIESEQLPLLSNQKNENGETLFMQAVKADHVEIVKLLLKKKEFLKPKCFNAESNVQSNPSLGGLIQVGDIEILQNALNKINKLLKNRSKLSEDECFDLDIRKRRYELGIADFKFNSEYMPCTQLDGIHLEIGPMLNKMPKETLQDYQNIIAELNAIPLLIDQTIDLLNKGVNEGITPPKMTIRKIPEQILAQVENFVTRSSFFKPFTDFPKCISQANQEAIIQEAIQVINDKVYAAFRKLHNYFVETYLPGCRETTGMSSLPNGLEWYAHLVRKCTTTELSPQEIHEIGLAEVKRIKELMQKTMEEANFPGILADFFKFLHSDPQFFYENKVELLNGYREITKSIELQLPKLFGKLPKIPYEIVQIPSHREENGSSAFYEAGSLKTGRPGRFFVNTYNLKIYPKWKMEALTLHEVLPGHHLQFSLALELLDDNKFLRQKNSYAAYFEGWGLYSESLGEQLGLYKNPYSKFGRLTMEMERAVRLVVDTGLHALGWSRQDAIDYFKSHVGSDDYKVAMEIDRYLVWPSQALSYKIGELKIQQWRAMAAERLGAKFDIRAFHDELLKDGALPLDMCEAKMIKWMDSRVKGEG